MSQEIRTVRCPVCGWKMLPSDTRCPFPSCNTPRDGNTILEPEMTPLAVWLTREEAKKIVEGAAVLVRWPASPPSYDKHFLYHVYGWFRPDLIDRGEFGSGDETYLLIENTIH